MEELAAVTNCAKASGYWGVLINQSLGLEATLLAPVQRGQEVDKSVMNASSFLWICQHNTEDDAKYIARKLGINIKLVPRIPLSYTVWAPTKGQINTGGIKFTEKGQVRFQYTDKNRIFSLSDLL